MYHIPTIIVYAFGVAGVRKLLKRLHRNNWKDLVEDSQEKLSKMVEEGTARFIFSPGFSLLFVGDGDQIARSLVVDDPTVGATMSSNRQPYTDLWGKYAVTEGDEGFSRVLEQNNAEDAGEYVLFPVLDEHLFLPGKNDFDIAPHRVDIAVQRIRKYEKEKGWKKKRIIIVGDNEQKNIFFTTSIKAQQYFKKAQRLFTKMPGAGVFFCFFNNFELLLIDLASMNGEDDVRGESQYLLSYRSKG